MKIKFIKRNLNYALYLIFWICLYTSCAYNPNNHMINQNNTNVITKQTNLVFGYLRKLESELPTIYIPASIKQICLFFYYGKDYFIDAYVGKYIRIYNNSTILTMEKHTKPNTAYGTLFINPKISKKIHSWKFKIELCNGYIYIGIDDAKTKWKDSCFAGKKETNNYSYCCNGRKYSHITGGMGHNYEKNGFCAGSIVMMELDLSSKSGSLSFGLKKYGNDWKNDVFFELLPAFQHIKKNNKFKLAVSLRSGSRIQLMEYKIKNPKRI